jgi:hypothetical protein
VFDDPAVIRAAGVCFLAAVAGFLLLREADVTALRVLGGVLLAVGGLGEVGLSVAAGVRRWNRFADRSSGR